MADRRLVQARGPFATRTTNGPWSVSGGDLYWSDDPVVRANPHNFREPTVQDSTTLIRQPHLGWASGTPFSETASAAPGTVRVPAPPTRPAAPVSTGAGRKGGTRPAGRPAEDGEV